MCITKSRLRVLVCTSAAGMGVNFVNTYSVIHYDPPSKIDILVRQIGRVGCDGHPAKHLSIYHGWQRSNRDPETLLYTKTTEPAEKNTYARTI